MKVNELKQLRHTKLAEMGNLIDSKDAENRDFTDVEKSKFDALDAEIRDLDSKIEQAEKEEALKARMVKNEGPVITKKENRTYSIVEHINQVRESKLDNFYADIQEKGISELKERGAYEANKFSVAIPADVVRTLSVTGDSGAKGGELVQTDKVGFLFELMEGSLIQRLGVTVLNGLTNNIDMPKQKNSMDAVWADENDNVGNIDFEVGSVPLRPTRLVAPYAISNKLLVQTAAESIVRQELQRKIRKALDTKFVETLLAQAGTIPVVMGADGDDLTYAKILEMIQKVGEASENIDAAKFLINFKTWATLKQTKIDAGSGQMVLQDGRLAGWDFVASNYMPSDIEKGNGDNLSALAFGDFSRCYLGNYATLELVIDPYTLANSGKTKIVSNSFHGFANTYPEAISIIKDAK